MNRIILDDSAAVNCLQDKRFKTNRLSVNCIVPLSKDKVSAYAMIPFLARKGYQGCDDFTMLNQKLNAIYGASLYTDISKYGDYQVITYSISAIDDHYSLEGEEVSMEAADILCNVFLHPSFLSDSFSLKEFELEKQMLIDSIEAEINDKGLYALQRMIHHLCKDDAYGIDRYGTIESVRRLTIEDVRNAFREMLRISSMELYYIGSGDSSKVIEKLRSEFQFERDAISSIHSTRITPFEMPLSVEETYNVNQSKLVMAFSADPQNEEEEYAMRMLSTLYGGTPRSKLFLNVRERLSLCYYCSSRYVASKGILYVNSGVEQSKVETAKEEILHQLDEIRNGVISDQEMTEMKMAILDSFKTVNDSAGAMESWYFRQQFFGKSFSPEEEAENFMKVTKEQIVAVSKKVSLQCVYLMKGESHDNDED